ncbi:uncharacterized protein LOC134213638 [Armigeres subalbatus]|uniref:uncharacterized protein LOC134213638 n=1 Tax=Armigeres subalbatus TaxID=124917 RepID=UPI002ED69612
MNAASLRLADLESRRICRFCLRICPTDGGGITDIGSDTKVMSKIAFALTLEVRAQDGLPQRICDGCEWLLEKFHLFKNQCVKAEMLLKTFADSGVPLMQYFEPVKFEEFRWKRKEWEGVEVGVQAVEETKSEPVYEVIAPEEIKQEVVEEDWSYAEEPVPLLNVDHADQITMDAIARQFYGTEGALQSFTVQDGVHNVSELVTDMDIGSPQLNAPNIEADDENSNDTVEFQMNKSAEPPAEPLPPVESYPNFSEAMLLLMEQDGDQTQDLKQPDAEGTPLSPSDVIYEGIPTTPLRESDGLSTRFIDLEPGEIVSDDELDNSSVVLLSSDNEEPDKPKPTIEPLPVTFVRRPSSTEQEYRCTKCDRAFPQAQHLEAHERSYHSKKKTTSAKTPSPQQKMAIMIDNPTKRCPKCAAMVHKASYWSHIRSHSSGERALVNYEKDQPDVPGATDTCLLEDDVLWDKS